MSTNLGHIATLGDGNGTGDKNLSDPCGIAVDSLRNRLVICDKGNNRILLWSLDGNRYIGEITTYGYDNEYDLNAPIGILCIEDYYYVTNTGDHNLLMFRADNLKYINSFGVRGSHGVIDTKLYSPAGLCTDNQYLYVVDTLNRRIVVLNKNLEWQSKSGIVGVVPYGICYDSLAKGLFVTDVLSNYVYRLNSSLLITETIGTSGDGEVEFNAPYGVCLVGDKLHIVDSGNSRIEVLSTTGDYVTEGIGFDYPNMLCSHNGVLFVTQWGTSDNVELHYNYDPNRELTETTTLTFTDDLPDGYEDLVVGDTDAYATPNNWVEETTNADQYAWIEEEI
jgi:hypothetical protein